MTEPAPAARVTVGVPAFNRPETLRRALESLARQSYPDIAVVVADDCSPDPGVARVVGEFAGRISRLGYVRRDRNLGLITNALQLRDHAQGEYFMWLADDDEISPGYVQALVADLDKDPDAVTAMGQWVELTGPTQRSLRRTSHFPGRRALGRMAAFQWRTDDAFFYGLHRTEAIRRCSFDDFWWPNRGTAMNWCFVFIADLVLQGPVVLSRDPDAQWISHNYTQKQYHVARFGPSAVGAFLIRRINVHALYTRKAARSLGVWVVPLLVPVSVASLVRELLELAPQLPRRLAGKSPLGFPDGAREPATPLAGSPHEHGRSRSEDSGADEPGGDSGH